MDEKEYDKLLRDAHLLGEFERKHPNPELKPGKCADCWNYEDNGGPCCGYEDKTQCIRQPSNIIRSDQR